MKNRAVEDGMNGSIYGEERRKKEKGCLAQSMPR